MATLSDIKSPVWTLSKNGGGAVAEGLAAIRQCIDLIVRTTKQTDPLRPEFGSDVYKYQDYPINVAIPNIKKALLDAIGIWETRVDITRIIHSTGDAGQVFFNLFYQLADGTLTDSILFTVSSDGIASDIAPSQLILQGYFPPNPNGYQYLIDLTLDGDQILPTAPSGGFSTPYEMYDWVQTNWSNYGRWYLNADSIVGYIDADFTTGNIAISISQQTRFEGGIPPLPFGDKYYVQISVGNTTYYSGTDLLLTADDILNYVNTEPFLSANGTWQIIINPDSFNDDFNEDFSVYQQLLQVYTQLPSVIINVTTVTQ